MLFSKDLIGERHILWVLLLFFSALLFGDDSYVVVCGFHAAQRLSMRDYAELRVGKRGGKTLVVTRLGRAGIEVWDCTREEPVKLLEKRGDGVRPGVGEVQLWMRASGTELVLNGKRIGAGAGIVLPGRPEVSFVPTDSIALKGKARMQKFSNEAFSDDFARVEDNVDDSQWEVISGSFEVNMSRNPGSSQSAFQLWASCPNGRGIALGKASRWFWRDMRLGVSFVMEDVKGRGGVAFNWLDGNNYHRYDAGADGARLVRVRKGVEEVLASTDDKVMPGAWTRMEVVCLDGSISAFLGGRRIMAVEDALAVSGRVGLVLENAEQAFFDDVSAVTAVSGDLGGTPQSPFGPCEQNWSDFSSKNFLTDPHMSQWAHPRSFWHEGGDGMLWFRNRFFNNLALAWQHRRRQKITFPVRVRLFADESKDGTGYLFTITRERVTLARNGVQAATAEIAIKALSDFDASADNGLITLSVNGGRVLEWRDGQPLTSGFLGADFGNTKGASHRGLHQPDWRDSALAKSTHRLDYSFEHAPAAWFPQAGKWQGTHRWACVPRWSFFGGRGASGATECQNANAILWNLRRVEGDFDLELFAAPMEGTAQRAHFSWPVTINVAFGGDGSHIGSGYNFVYGSYDMPSKLYYHEAELASNNTRVDSGLRLKEVPWYHRMTQTWQHIRIQRRNGRILVDGATHGDEAEYQGLKKIFDEPDKCPDLSGQFAVWTWGENGIAIARATLSYEKSSGAASAPVQHQAVRKMKGAKGEPKEYARYTNTISGGAFATVIHDGKIDVDKSPVLEMTWRPAEHASLSLMLKVRDQVAESPLTGGHGHPYTLALPAPKAEAVKGMPGWMKVTLELRDSLRNAFPDKAPLAVESISIASPYGDLDEIAGLQCNVIGSHYDVAEVKVVYKDVPAKRDSASCDAVYDGVVFYNGFEDGFGQWARMGGPDGAALSLDWREPAGGEYSLRLLNQLIGGPAGAYILRTPYRLAAFPSISMMMKIPLGIEINLIAVVNGKNYEVVLTGVDYTWEVVGKAAGVSADNKWHKVTIDLAAMLKPRLGDNAVVDAIMLADSYRMSCYQRTAYWVDDFQLVPALSEGSAIELRSSSENNPVVAHKISVDGGAEAEAAGNAVKVISGKGALVRVQPKYKDGTWGKAFPVTVSKAAAPLAAARAPEAVAAAGLPAPYISYIPSDRLAMSNFDTLPGETESLATFGDMSIRREAWVLRDTGNAATGNGSGQMVNLAPNGFYSFYFRKAPWDPRRWPMVSFDYCFMTAGCALNMTLLVNEAMTVVEWTGPNGVGNYFYDSIVGKTQYAIQDGKWHRTEFNLLEMLKNTRYAGKLRGNMVASELATWATVHNGGGYSNPHDARVFIDNFVLYSNKGRDPAFLWKMPKGSVDAAGFSYSWSKDDKVMPPDKSITAKDSVQFKGVEPGTWFFKVKACDAQGKWGPAGTIQVQVDEN